MRNSYLVFGQPLLEQPEIDEVLACMKSAWLGTGPKVAEFEKRVAAYDLNTPTLLGTSSQSGVADAKSE